MMCKVCCFLVFARIIECKCQRTVLIKDEILEWNVVTVAAHGTGTMFTLCRDQLAAAVLCPHIGHHNGPQIRAV